MRTPCAPPPASPSAASPPLAHETPLPVAIDASLGRFETAYAAAGHPHCVFATTIDELARLTGGTVTPEIAVP